MFVFNAIFCNCFYQHFNGFALCVTVDERVPLLIMAVKLWAKKNNVYDAHLGLLSSYSWTLMVINYLQCVYSVETLLIVTIIGYYSE